MRKDKKCLKRKNSNWSPKSMKGNFIREHREYVIKQIIEKMSDYKVGSKVLLNTLKTIEYFLLNCSVSF